MVEYFDWQRKKDRTRTKIVCFATGHQRQPLANYCYFTRNQQKLL